MMASRYVIQCRARCADRGCPDHKASEWRKSKRLPVGTTLWGALRELRKHRQECWKSGPYRLRKERW